MAKETFAARVEERKKENEALTKIVDQACEGSYFRPSSIANTYVNKVFGLAAPLFAGVYAGLNHSQGLDLEIPMAAIGGLALSNGVYGLIVQHVVSGKVRAYSEENTEVTGDKDKIRQFLDDKVATMPNYERNKYLINQKVEVGINTFTGKIDLSEFILKQYVQAHEQGNEEEKQRIVNSIGSMTVKDNLNLSKGQKEALEILASSKTKYYVGGFSAVRTGLLSGAGYLIGRVFGSLLN